MSIYSPFNTFNKNCWVSEFSTEIGFSKTPETWFKFSISLIILLVSKIYSPEINDLKKYSIVQSKSWWTLDSISVLLSSEITSLFSKYGSNQFSLKLEFRNSNIFGREDSMGKIKVDKFCLHF